MAVAIGATTAIFSVVDATLLHPLPYPNASQLVQVVDDLPGVGAKDVGISIPEWKDLERSGIFEYVAPIGGGDVNLTGLSQPTRIAFLNVPTNYFALLGIKPELGRTFDPEDKTPGFTLELCRRIFAIRCGLSNSGTLNCGLHPVLPLRLLRLRCVARDLFPKRLAD
jgi:putative ABC transport system permease protein